MTQTYRPNIEMFYGTVNDNNSKIIPAPNMGISINYSYANDAIVGYTYTVTLNGTITSLDLRDLSYGDEYDPTTYNQRNIGSLADSIDKLRFLLIQNGNVLHITNAATGIAFFKAKGGILRSFVVDQSQNNWANSAQFNASIEFNAVEINDTEDCYNSFLDITGFPTNDKGIVDVNTYKLKDFSDSWSFNFEAENYNVVGQTEYNDYINLDNSHFKLTYEANATGKSYYIYSDEDTSEATLIPAWEQAKNFVQYRLYNQVTSLIDGVLKTYPSGCGSADGLNDINIPGNTASGLLSSLGDGNYGIYNEEISCESSESQGTFSASYNCIVRHKNGGVYSPSNCFHKIQKSINNANSNRPTRTISLTGSIEGLIEGGIVRSNQPLELPAQGKLFIYSTMASSQEKIRSAQALLNTIHNPSAFSGGFGFGKKDFYQHFKNDLGINAAAFSDMGISPSNDDPYSGSFPHPTTFNLTYNYLEGTINYNVEYSSLANCSVYYNNITIDTEDRTKVFVVLDIPGSNSCGVVQQLGTYTLKKVNVNIDGYDASLVIGNIDNIDQFITCGTCSSIESLPVNIPNGYITEQQYTMDPITGKYQIALSYICPQDEIC